MKILALETSSPRGSVALQLQGGVAEAWIETPRAQTERLLPLAQQLLAEAGMAGPAELDAIAFGRGPGSFTGLRIAAAAAQGLSLAAGLPVLAISSLAALAQGAWRLHGVERCLVCLDARMGEVYWGGFTIREGLAEPEGSERIGSPDASIAPEEGRPWAAVGDGWVVYGEVLASLLARAERALPPLFPAARDLLPLAARDLAAGRAIAPEEALPVYLRDQEAWHRRKGGMPG